VMLWPNKMTVFGARPESGMPSICLFVHEISAASLKLKPGGPTQASGPVFNFAVISIRD